MNINRRATYQKEIVFTKRNKEISAHTISKELKLNKDTSLKYLRELEKLRQLKSRINEERVKIYYRPN